MTKKNVRKQNRGKISTLKGKRQQAKRQRGGSLLKKRRSSLKLKGKGRVRTKKNKVSKKINSTFLSLHV